MNPLEFIVEAGTVPARLDRWLAARLTETSRTQIQTWIQTGRVTVSGQIVRKPSHPLTPGDVVRLNVPPKREVRVEPQPIPLKILYEDAHLIALDKPAGMVVYPAPGHPRDTLVNALLAHTRLASVGAPVRPGIVHRLDKDTSGVIVVAKTDEAYHGLIRQFKARTLQAEAGGATLKKTYLAWVQGRLREDAGRIVAPIGRHPVHRQRMAVVASGKPAVTAFRVRRRLPHSTLVEVELFTGRTHQVRVHFAHIRHPVLGDPHYGRGGSAARLLLHAWRLELDHPLSGERLELEAPLPSGFAPPEKA